MRNVVKVLVLAGMTTATLAGAAAVAGEPPRQAEPTARLVPPPPVHPFGAIETRPLWDRPVERPTVQQQTERALDRGTGRIVDEPTFELDRQRLQELEREGRVPIGSTYQFERDRADQIEQQRVRDSATQQRRQQTERESESLATERQQWESVLRRENAAGGAVVDQQALARVEQEYSAQLAAALKQRDASVAGIDSDATLRPDQRRARRAEILGQYNAARQAAQEQRSSRRAIILGWPPRGGSGQ
jgi:hypothetical protein